jgi:uncharacterized protein (DUF1330 family)
MNVENRVYPDPEQLARLRSPGDGGPVVMVNLLKFRDKARYPDGRDPEISGREAYHRYGVEVAKLLEALGGRVLFVGDVRSLSLGHVESLWDEVALAEYPSRETFLRMMTSREMREIAVHREAGLEGQLNIETTPALEGLFTTAR